MATVKNVCMGLLGVVVGFFCPAKAIAETEKSPGSRLSDLVFEVVPAIATVESGGNPSAKGDKNKKTGRYDAIGMYQLHTEYVRDVNRIIKLLKMSIKPYRMADRLNPYASRQMVKFYLYHYGSRYRLDTGKEPTAEVLARIHNGGPLGYKKKATEKYWLKVKAVMDGE